jgi:hypothetical protein
MYNISMRQEKKDIYKKIQLLLIPLICLAIPFGLVKVQELYFCSGDLNCYFWGNFLSFLIPSILLGILLVFLKNSSRIFGEKSPVKVLILILVTICVSSLFISFNGYIKISDDSITIHNRGLFYLSAIDQDYSLKLSDVQKIETHKFYRRRSGCVTTDYLYTDNNERIYIENRDPFKSLSPFDYLGNKEGIEVIRNETCK